MCEENKKPEVLTDDQLEGASGGGIFDALKVGAAAVAGTMHTLFADKQYTYTCPTCGYSETITIGASDYPPQKTCPHCNISLKLSHN